MTWSRLTISQRFLLVTLIPMCGMLLISGVNLVNRQSLINEMETMIPNVALARDGSALVNELQRERGYSARFLSVRGASKYADALEEQRARTDAAFQTFVALSHARPWSDVDPQLARRLQLVDDEMGRLSDQRGAVDARSVAVRETVRFYSDVVEELIGMVGRMAQLTADRGVANELVTYRALMWAKEKADLNRSIGASLFDAGGFEPRLYQDFVTVYGEEQSYLAEFNLFASPQDSRLYAESVEGTATGMVEDWRKVLLDLASTNDTHGISGSEWFDKAGERVERIGQVADRIASNLAVTSKGVLGDAQFHSWMLLALNLAMLAVASGVGHMVAQSIKGPLAGITAGINAIAEGDVSVEMPKNLDPRNELGQIAQAAEIFRQTTLERQQLEAAREAQEQAALVERREALRNMASTVKDKTRESVSAISQGAAELNGQADQMRGASEELQVSTEEVAALAQQTRRTTDMVAGASSEMNSAIEEISQQINRTTALSQEAVGSAQRSQQTIDQLSQAASDIGEVIKIINDIAEQTNLLALNATIEAARAGEAGKGFAVVASEVKNLANQTGKSTEEISRKVSEMQASTRDAVQSLTEISKTITDIDGAATAIAGAMEQQSVTTREISNSMKDTSGAVENVSGRIDQMAGMARRTHEIAENVHAVAAKMTDSSKTLTHEVARIVHTATSETDRRMFERHPVEMSSPGQVGDQSAVFSLRDLSGGGAGIRAMEGAQLGDKVKMEVPGFGQLEGTIVRMTPDTHGIQFDVDEATQFEIADYLSGKSEAA